MRVTPLESRGSAIRFDQGRHWRGKIGFVLLAMEQTVEDDVFTLTPQGVGVHFARIPMSNQVTAETLAAMAPGITACAERILPEGDLDVLCYTCNSGTMVIGEEKVFAALRKANPAAKPTTVMTGVVRALRAFDARRIAVATPYLDEVNGYVHRFLTERGFDILAMHGMGIANNTEIDRVAPEYIREYAYRVDHPEADAVVLVCGAMRSLDIAGPLEQDLEKPVVVSNQAMMWDCLRLCGVEDRFPGYGKLFALGVDVHQRSC